MQQPMPRRMIDPFMLSMIAAQLYPSIESWGEKDQAESAVDAASRILIGAIKKADEMNAGQEPPAQQGPPGGWGGAPTVAWEPNPGR